MQTFLLPIQICHLVASDTDIVKSVPNAFIVTIISVIIVFLSLICLAYTYSLIGKAVTSWQNRQKQQEIKKDCEKPGDKEAVAIATALELYMNEYMHDEESYVITIKRKR